MCWHGTNHFTCTVGPLYLGSTFADSTNHGFQSGWLKSAQMWNPGYGVFILYKGLEHLQILVSVGDAWVVEPIPRGYQGTTVFSNLILNTILWRRD